MITQERLKEVLLFDESTGLFTWLPRKGFHMAGRAAGSVDNGYLRIKVDNVLYRAHRLAWLYVYGKFPSQDLDHINGIRSDNAIANLREASSSANGQNRIKSSKNTSGYIGVFFNKRQQCWTSVIINKRKHYYLGTYDTAEDAAESYALAKAALHTFNPEVVTR